MLRSGALLGLLGWLVLATGCATMVREPLEYVRFESEPIGAQVKLDPGGQETITPGALELDRRHNYYATFEREGYAPETIQLTRVMGTTTWGNLILGGFIGFIVDEKTGAAYRYSPNPVKVALRPLVPRVDPDACTVVFFNDSYWKRGKVGVISIEIGDRFVGRLPVEETLTVELTAGMHTLRLEHTDVGEFGNEYEIEISERFTYIRLDSRPLSTTYEIVEDPPDWAVRTWKADDR